MKKKAGMWLNNHAIYRPNAKFAKIFGVIVTWILSRIRPKLKGAVSEFAKFPSLIN